MRVLAVTFHLAADHIDAFRTRIQQQASDSLANEADCLQFDVCFDPDDSSICFLYEKYADDAAIEAHRSTPYFADYFETTKDWIVDKQVRTLTVASSDQ